MQPLSAAIAQFLTLISAPTALASPAQPIMSGIQLLLLVFAPPNFPIKMHQIIALANPLHSSTSLQTLV